MFKSKNFEIPKTIYFGIDDIKKSEPCEIAVKRVEPVSVGGEKEALAAIVKFTNDTFEIKVDNNPKVDLLLRSITTTQFVNKMIDDLKLPKVEKEQMMLLSLDLENLELIGDAVLKEAFLNFVFVKYADGKILNRRHGQMISSRLLIEYMRTKYQSQLCIDIGLSTFIRHHGEKVNNETTQEDVFEAWIGACRLIIGYDKVYDFLMKLFESLKIDTDFDTIVDAKTQLNDLAATLALKVVNGETTFENDNCTVKLLMGSYTSFGTGPCDSMRGMPSSKSASLMAAKNMISVFIDANGQQEYLRLLNRTASFAKWKLSNVETFQIPTLQIPTLQIPVNLKRRRDEEDNVHEHAVSGEKLGPNNCGISKYRRTKLCHLY